MKVRIASKDGNGKVADLNRRRAIRERCLDCAAWSARDVAECQLSDCPLHPFRTGKGSQDAKVRSRAIRAYCLECAGGSRGEVAKCASPLCALYVYRLGTPDNTVILPEK